MSETNGHREQLEQRADELRAKLEQRVQLIELRRHRLADVARAAVRPPTAILLFAVAGAAAALFLIHHVRSRRVRPSLAERLVLLLQPAALPEQPGMLTQSVKKAATSLAVTAVKRIGTRGLERWLAEPESPARVR